MKLLLRRIVLVTAIIYSMSKTWEVFKETGLPIIETETRNAC